ncbi:LxmA leader domain family RiPP [Streptomyces sp. ISL-11]|uniref:LxmA leader domain family RiPP n=1 Tax=Streptomyces sp. ISL-11 TaxID=2819174 RepID=UPI001BEC093A|nr:LxmA leader domain family RiPP [Streptomyces sp. ISL-11]MBT2386680.1 LxmA leader domain family RiPP [Streptomyces sp. ISL-11]
MTNDLIAGYTAYTSAAEFGAASTADAPASTPLASVVASSAWCGPAASLVSGAVVSASAHWGC